MAIAAPNPPRPAPTTITYSKISINVRERGGGVRLPSTSYHPDERSSALAKSRDVKTSLIWIIEITPYRVNKQKRGPLWSGQGTHGRRGNEYHAVMEAVSGVGGSEANSDCWRQPHAIRLDNMREEK